MSTAHPRTFCVLRCLPHSRLKKAWIVELGADEEDLPIGAVLLQFRPAEPPAQLGRWKVVGWSTDGMVLMEPVQGTRDNMLPADRFLLEEFACKD